jgi:hypothetical protein
MTQSPLDTQLFACEVATAGPSHGFLSLFLDRPLFAKPLIAQVRIQLAQEKLCDTNAKPPATEACDNQKDKALGWHGFQDIYGRFVSATDAKYPL